MILLSSSCKKEDDKIERSSKYRFSLDDFSFIPLSGLFSRCCHRRLHPYTNAPPLFAMSQDVWQVLKNVSSSNDDDGKKKTANEKDRAISMLLKKIESFRSATIEWERKSLAWSYKMQSRYHASTTTTMVPTFSHSGEFVSIILPNTRIYI